MSLKMYRLARVQATPKCRSIRVERSGASYKPSRAQRAPLPGNHARNTRWTSVCALPTTAWAQQRRGFLEVFKAFPLEDTLSKEGQISLSHAKIGAAADKRTSQGAKEAEAALAASLAKFGPQVYPFYLIIHMYCKMDNLPMVEAKLEQMQSLGLRPDTDTYNALIEYFIQTNRTERAEKLLEEAIANKCFDTITVRMALNYVFNRTGQQNPEPAEQLWNRFKEAGYKPTKLAYDTLFSIYVNSKYDIKAINLLHEFSTIKETLEYIEPRNWERIARCEIGVDAK